ncbi:creatininase family protein [Mycobacterium avium]|uniref:creatininase family protein n=1 Tax=Mycobacterium avium TaxID=1764 RepID=UPI0007A05AC1|nr:creatininase family protein [Mycobacterium avium]
MNNVAKQATPPKTPVKVGPHPSRKDGTEPRAAAGTHSSNHDDRHAGEREPSTRLAPHPDSLRDGWQTSDHTANDRRYLTSLGIHAYTPTGVIGSPSQATAAKGSNVLDHLGRNADTLIGLLTTR